MIAVCAGVRTSELADHQRGRFAGIDQTYALTAGEAYVVLAVGIWETILQVLVRDDDGLPIWCPAGLFDIETQQMPAHWEFSLDEGVGASGPDLWTRWVARWGYPEVVRDPAHSDALMERDPHALEIFARELQQRERDLLAPDSSRDQDGQSRGP